MKRSSFFVAAIILLSGTSRAQEPYRTLQPPTSQPRFGYSVSELPDVDGDEVADMVIGAPAWNDGRVYVYSGVDGTLLQELVSMGVEDWFGIAVAGISDVNGDGYGDIVVGAEGKGGGIPDAGRAYVFSGTDGAMLHTLASPNETQGGRFGGSVAGIRDVDGDGRSDVLVGQPGSSDQPVWGYVYIFSGATGALLQTLEAPSMQVGGFFGQVVAGVPDVDGDGSDDVLVGAYREDWGYPSQVGRAYVFSGASGSLLHTLNSPNEDQFGNFGFAVAGLPDLDGDGQGELLVGASGEGAHTGGSYGAGRAYVFRGSSANLLHTLNSPNQQYGGHFGNAVAGVPDVNGDGQVELLVGAYREFPSPHSEGRAYVFSGGDGALFYELASPDERQTNSFGYAATGIEDLDGDGRGDLLIGVGEGQRAFLYSGGIILSVAPGAIAFGEVLVGAVSAPEAVTVTNTGSTAHTITAFTLEGDEPEVFQIVTAPPVPLTLQPGEQAVVEVAFAPTGAGVAEALLRFESEASSAPARLSGFGVLPSGQALVVTKSTDSDDGTCDVDCSLREAITAGNEAPGADRITFDPALTNATLSVTIGQLSITDDLVIDAEDRGVIVSGDYGSRLFEISTLGIYQTNVSFIGLTIEKGGDAEDEEGGGGIYNHGTLTLTRCVVRDNRLTLDDAGGGAGISNASGAVLTVVDSRIAGNRSISIGSLGGGGLYNAGTATLIRTTVSGNAFGSFEVGGGIRNEGTLTLIRSTVSDNRGRYGDGIGIYTSLGTFPGEALTTLIESTVSGNRMWEDHDAYALKTSGSATTRLIRTTVTRNDGGVSVSTDGASAVFEGSIIAGNRPVGSSPADCALQHSTSNGYNVFGEGCPLEGPGDVAVAPGDVFTLVLDGFLTHNGGPTRTHALRYADTNPAIDIGGTCGPADQRGVPSPLDGPDADAAATCDAGAIEADTPDLQVSLVPAALPVVIPGDGGDFTYTATLSNRSGVPQSLQAWVRAARPDGGYTRLLYGPVAVAVQPGQSVTRSLAQHVPGGALPGEYDYLIYVGGYPDGAIGGMSFPVVKEPRPVRIGSMVAWPSVLGGGPEAMPASSETAPSTFALHAPRPNPFAARVAVGFDLPAASHVRLVIYDVLGREVIVLLDAEVTAGRHEAVLDGARLPSGVFFVRMEADGFVQTQRLTRVR